MGHSSFSYVYDTVTHALVELSGRKSLLVVNYNQVSFTLLSHDKNRQKKSPVVHIYWVWWKMESKKCEGKYTWSSLLPKKYGFPQKLVKSAHSVRFSPLGMRSYVERVSQNKTGSRSV